MRLPPIIATRRTEAACLLMDESCFLVDGVTDLAVFLVALTLREVAALDALLLVEERVLELAAVFLAGLGALVFAADLALLLNSG